MAVQTTISPIDGSAVAKRELADDAAVDAVLARAAKAFASWRKTPLRQRLEIVNRFLDLIQQQKDALAKELTEEMGRPIRFAGGEINGFVERGRYMIDIAEQALADTPLTDTDKPGFKRYIRREALGVVLIISAWNVRPPKCFDFSLVVINNNNAQFPYLIQANSIFPAILAGNTVILKPSPQTPSPSERIAALLQEAGLPDGVCQVLHTSPEQLDRLVLSPYIAHVSFTGSVANGRRVEQGAAKSNNFKSVGLELGGKDAAYVREDADIEASAVSIADGAFFNSGQSCCAIERIYVHEKVHDQFVARLLREANSLKLGDPRQQQTSLGPVISTRSAETIRAHIKDALQLGAKSLVDESKFTDAKEGSTFVAPQIFVNADHSMKLMTEETFGPVVGVTKVKTDDEALGLINDSIYGLTASIWTKDVNAFVRLEPDVNVGTVFMNRCDYLDPALAWTGVKDSGRGVSLSRFGYDALTRAKSVHIKQSA